ncbi:unnamed protein product [Fraxinus pennsylvanica]|uniref:Uncharacterized protein n=1 Tax=Fraxinus pennsylvanica TaxID=56036 RepID=A0AAD1YN35_9LAMI|nr:unnamed protein product [Fraxinus pennsylvanica]
MTVITRMPKAVTFNKISLSFMDPKEVMKFPIAVDTRIRLLTFASLSVTAHMLVVRSTGSFIATCNNDKVAAFIEKYFDGNHNFLVRNPWNTSAVIAREQTKEAAATYMPIHGMGASSCRCTSPAFLLLGFIKQKHQALLESEVLSSQFRFSLSPSPCTIPHHLQVMSLSTYERMNQRAASLPLVTMTK